MIVPPAPQPGIGQVKDHQDARHQRNRGGGELGLLGLSQIAWAEYHQTVAEVIKPPSNLVVACGMSIGYADPDIPRPAMPRMALSEAVTFAG